MHITGRSYAWFIFNLNTKSCYSQIIYYSVCTQDMARVNPAPCLYCPLFLLATPYFCYPLFTYLENQLSCLWCEYPSTLVPGLLRTAHPLLLLPPFHTPQIKLQYLHRRHQQYQSSSSDTLISSCPTLSSVKTTF
jgi:hypothetical protein